MEGLRTNTGKIYKVRNINHASRVTRALVVKHHPANLPSFVLKSLPRLVTHYVKDIDLDFYARATSHLYDHPALSTLETI